MMASMVWSLCFCLTSAAASATFLFMEMIRLLSKMRLILFVGFFPSLRYLDFISVRQIEGVYRGPSPSMYSLTLLPLLEPLKYSIHAKESRAFMGFFLVS